MLTRSSVDWQRGKINFHFAIPNPVCQWGGGRGGVLLPLKYRYTLIYMVVVIVIPWVVRLYVEIIHELWRVDYLTYRWTNMVKLFHTTYICVDLAHHEIFRA